MPSRWEKDGFPLLPGEMERFRPALDRSWEAVFVIAWYLHWAGNVTVTIGARVYRPAGGNPADYGDSHDVTITFKGSQTTRRYEVKRRTFHFTCQADFPYPSLIVDRVKSDRPDPHGYYCVNEKMTHAAFIPIVTKPSWEGPETIFDSKKGHEVVVYKCPKELAQFFDLREPPGVDMAPVAKTG